MQTYRLLLDLDGPLAVSQARDTSNRYALPPAVPPTTLRGALAAAIGESSASLPEESPSMDVLFGPRGCRTSALLPSAGAGSAGRTRAGKVRPAPLTMRTCKRHGGLKEEKAHSEEGARGEKEAHGMQDVLFSALLFALKGDAGGLRDIRMCQAEGCSQVLEDVSGALGTGPEGAFYRPPEPSTRTQAHVGLDRRRQGAASGILYSREVISEKTSANGTLEPTRMQADVTGPAEVMEVLGEALGEGTTLRIGTSRSRGLGACQVQAFREVSPSTLVPAPRPLDERIETFNQRWEDWCSAHGHSPGRPLVALTLQTPALFVDDLLRPSLSPGAGALLQSSYESEQPMASALETLEKVHQIARPTQVQSWNGMAEFPHRSAEGLAPGSVLVFRAERLGGGVLGALEHLEDAGIGLRRHFGFGRVRACSPIHTDLHEHVSHAPDA